MTKNCFSHPHFIKTLCLLYRATVASTSQHIVSKLLELRDVGGLHSRTNGDNALDNRDILAQIDKVAHGATCRRCPRAILDKAHTTLRISLYHKVMQEVVHRREYV